MTHPPKCDSPSQPETTRRTANLATLTHADFVAHLNEDYSLHLPQKPLSATLISAQQLPSRGAAQAGRREPFSLIFRVTGASYLPQQIYALEHERLGRLDIFLVPIARDEQGLRMEAIFS
jgi:hypothetical protein